MVKIKHLDIEVKGIKWKVFVQTPSAYKKMHGKDSSAITYPGDREVYFRKDDIDSAVIIHELIHIFVASCGISSSGLTAEQMEELICEAMGEHYIEIGKLCFVIYNFIAKEK